MSGLYSFCQSFLKLDANYFERSSSLKITNAYVEQRWHLDNSDSYIVPNISLIV